MIIRTQFPDLFLTTMLPALDELIMGRYNKLPSRYTKVYRMLTSSRSIEQTTEMAGLGLLDAVPEGGNVRYDVGVPAFPKTYTHNQFALGFQISRIMVDDDRFSIMAKLATDLGKSAYESKELDAVTTFNNGFTAGAFAGPDGQALFSTAHPLVKSGGTQTNTLAVAADLDISSIELALTDFRNMRDHTGKRIRVDPKKLVIPTTLEFAASEIMNSTMRSDTANHTINAFQNRVGMPGFEEVFLWEYLSDPDAWFIVADPADTELRWYDREKFSTAHETHFDSRSIKTAGWQRYSYGYSNFFGLYGSPGA
jgi:phage major head subunit gpT-like protein